MRIAEFKLQGFVADLYDNGYNNAIVLQVTNPAPNEFDQQASRYYYMVEMLKKNEAFQRLQVGMHVELTVAISTNKLYPSSKVQGHHTVYADVKCFGGFTVVQAPGQSAAPAAPGQAAPPAAIALFGHAMWNAETGCYFRQRLATGNTEWCPKDADPSAEAPNGSDYWSPAQVKARANGQAATPPPPAAPAQQPAADAPVQSHGQGDLPF